MSITITSERPDTPDAVALITELEDELEPLYPPTSRHGYSVEKLIAQGVAFFVLRYADAPAGCGGVQLFPEGYGELKRMYVRPQYRGKGLAHMILDRLAEHTRATGVRLVRLETGLYQHDAIRLYERAGFRRVGPFGPYRDDPLSVFMEKLLDGADKHYEP